MSRLQRSGSRGQSGASKVKARILKVSFKRRTLCLVIIANLLMFPTPFLGLARLAGQVLWASRAPSKVETAPARKSQLNSLSDRLAAIYQIRVSPNKLVAYTSQVVGFSAVGSDAVAEAVQGPKFNWSSSDSSVISIDEAGRATMLKPGLCWITCRAGLVQQRVPVLVRPGPRPVQTMTDWIKDQNSLDQNGNVTAAGGGMARLIEKLAPAVEAQNGGYLGDYLWNYVPNLTGNPRNRMIVPTRIGAVLPESSNFNLAIPLVSLQGRGLDLNLTAYANSKMWFKNGSSIFYNPLGGFPAPGFSLGFGYIATYTSSLPPYDTAYAFVDRDGTFRYMGHGSSGSYQTQDGTHITFTGSASFGGTLSYTDGTQVTISIVNNNLLPTQVTDRNGNYLTIAYKDTTQGYNPLAIDFITDTLGRNVQFHYNINLNLDYITVPTMNGGTQNSVFFFYTNQTLSYNFSGLTPVVAGSTGPFLNNINFAATSTGYTLSYSDYGMPYNVSLRRNMQMPGNNGSESASMNFNYPTSGSTVLTDAPAFTQYTDSPGGTYSISNSSNSSNHTLTYTITRPDSSTLALTRSTDTTSTANGLLTYVQINSSGGSQMGLLAYAYVSDPGGSPQVLQVLSFDDAGNQRLVNFDYNASGFVTNKREFGFQQSGSWAVRRRSHVNYTSAGGAVVPTEVDLYDALVNMNDADDVLIAKTTYDIDNYNYAAPLTGIEDYGGSANPPGHYSSFNASYTSRGNVTGQTQWTDLTANTSITRQAKLDIFANVTKANVSCCNQKTFTFDQSTYWTNAGQITSGDPNSTHLTSSYTYDFNTSKETGMTDPNNLGTTYQYDANLRPTVATLPTGATADASFNDGSLSASSFLSYTDNGINKTPTSSQVTDGWGHITQTTDPAGNQVNYAYNNMGQLQSRTNPFPPSGTPGASTTFQYDALGRVTRVILPDNNTLQTNYSGNTVTSTDQVGRQTQRQLDGLGRLVTINEQDPATGSLTQATNYSYDYLDDLTQVNQGGQTRAWKYDAIGRMLYERIPEQTATINDGTGTMWSCKYTYTDFGAIASKTDARGAVTTFVYDSLNRVYQISYDTSHAPGVATTPTVTYNYDTSTTSTTKGLPLSVTNGFEERYSYDPYNRVSTVTDFIGSKSYARSYQYNTASQIVQLTYPSQRNVSTSYDNLGRLSTVGGTGPNGCSLGLCGVSFNAAGQVTTLTLGNGVVQNFGYDAQRLEVTSETATKGGTTLMSLTYGYQAAAGQMGVGTTAGNTGGMVSISGTINGTTESAGYTFDLLGRMATSSQSTNGFSAQRRFAYDRCGNRTGVWDATSGGNQIQSVTLQQSGGAPTNRLATVTNLGTPATYSYDAAGNVLGDGNHSYVYDAENRIVSADGGVTTYAYDYASRRVMKVSGGVTTHYVYDGDTVLAEHNGSSGAVLVDYIYANGLMIAKQPTGASTRYFLADKLNSRVTMDASGTVLGLQGHLPFGEEFGESGEQDKHHFTSYESDAETGLDYALNRLYSPTVGRFMSADPYSASGYATNPQSWNRYNYTGNDPVNYSDGSGLFAQPTPAPPPILPPIPPLINPIVTPPNVYDPNIPSHPIGGGQISQAAQAKSRLVDALKNLPKKCKDFFGGEGHVNDSAEEVRNGSFQIDFIAQGGPGWYDKIPKAPRSGFLGLGGRPTYRDFWHSSNQPRAAESVVFDGHSPREYHTVLLGNAFFNGPPDNNDPAWRALPAKGRLEAWQDMILVHEYMHQLNDMGDQDLVNKWTEEGAEIPDDPDPSERLSLWIAKGCPNHKAPSQ